MARRRRLFGGVLAVFCFGVVELVSFAACRFLTSKGIFFEASRGDLAVYRRSHDPVLGWPAPSQSTLDGRDAVGARRSPHFPDRGASRPAISCYGDSFTWADEATDAEAWPEQLAVRLGRRVDNFGVGGYGTDQALLRFRQKMGSGIDRAPVVLLVHLSENVARNLNQFRDLLYGGGGGLGFKPRFVLDAQGALRAVPLVVPELDAYEGFLEDPAILLRHETFLPGSSEGARVLRVPFTGSAVLAATHPRIRAVLANEPHYAHLYRRDHPAQGARLTAAILESFWREARAMGRLGVPMIMPTGLDIEHLRRTGAWTYASLVMDLRLRQVPVLDLGPFMEKRMRGRPLGAFFAGGDIGRHMNASGNRLAAEVIQAHMGSGAGPPRP